MSKDSHGDTVLGSRFMKGSRLSGYDLKRIAGNRVLNIIYSVFAQRRLSDLGSGLNIFKVSDLEPTTYLSFGNTLSFNYELILDFVRRRVQFRFAPITWREEDQVSNARNMKIFIAALKILGVWTLNRKADRAIIAQQSFAWTEVGL